MMMMIPMISSNFSCFTLPLQVVLLMWVRTITVYQYRYGISMATAFSRLYREGGIARFYEGWEYAVIQGPLARFGSIAANELAILIFAHTSHSAVETGKTPVKISLASTTAATVAASIVDRLPKQALATLIGGLLSSCWRGFLMPIDTCKTILQVDGSPGLAALMTKIASDWRNAILLYEGTGVTLVGTFIAHYPWFMVHNYLDHALVRPSRLSLLLLRNAFIGFTASALSDTVSNSLRVIKTVKQSLATETKQLSYLQVVALVYREGGVSAFLGRGLLSRILSNGLQSILFTVIWKLLMQRQQRQQDSGLGKKTAESTVEERPTSHRKKKDPQDEV
jgi:hypothetical protein